MHTFQQSLRAGLLFLVGAGLLVVVYFGLSGRRAAGGDGYDLVAGFATLRELTAGDDVRLAGVPIGTVAATRLGRGRVEAVLRIQPGVEVPRDSVATIATTGLIGGAYVSLTLGDASAGVLAAGGEVRTAEGADLQSVLLQIQQAGARFEQVAGDIGKAIETISGGPEGGVFTRLDRLVATNEGRITSTLDNIDRITGQMAAGQGTLGKLVFSEETYDELYGAVTQIRVAAEQVNALVGQAGEVFARVQSGEGALGKLIYDEQVATNLVALTTNLRDVSDRLARGEGTLGRLLTEDAIYVDAQRIVRKADQTLDALGDQGPLTALGIAVNALF